ncbi:MAG TPA: ABC transporter permease [Candidatus Limnocylindrales bacterium]
MGALADSRSGVDPASAGRGRRRHPAFAIGGTITVRGYIGTAALTFAALIAAWLIIRALNLAPVKFLPGPLEVLDRLGKLASDGTLWSDISVSVWRIIVGFTLATVIAVPIGILIGTYRFAEALIEPFIDFVRYMPVVGFVPLTIVWIGIDDSQKFAIVFIGTFFQEVLLVMDNVKRVPMDLVNIGRTLGMRDSAILARIVAPSAAPGIWDTLRISLGWAWTWVVLAELVAATSGLGYRINLAPRYFQTDVIIGYLIVLGILGLVTDQTMKALGRLFFRWSER